MKALGVLGLLCTYAGSSQTVDFNRDVRPILSGVCLHCHGPDAASRQAGLRLDTREGMLAGSSRGPVVVPGRSNESRLFQRVSHEKPALRMPPPYAKKPLSSDQIETLRRWIDEGASWQAHWAFNPPALPVLPAVQKEGWARNPIDTFILAKLEGESLEPAPEADRRALIRRVSLDLTGLPPSPAEVVAFLNDTSPAAYEKLVDRLLASERWGEHRARYWLDAARYGDTHGLHADNYREIWPYRDWVIQAFNRNLPFDRFTVEQLAGDLLPSPTPDQLTATGFHRCNITTNEGGVIPDEAAALYARDRVETTGTVWLGLTVGCAACHDHKFDPVTQKDFYQLAAFFTNTTQEALDGNISSPPPVLVVPRAEDTERWHELNRRARQLRKEIGEKVERARGSFDNWLAARKEIDFLSLVTLPESLFLPLTRSLFSLLAGHAGGRPFELPLPSGAQWTSDSKWPDAVLEFVEKSSLEIPQLPSIEINRPFSFAAWVRVPEEPESVLASRVGMSGEGARWVLAIRGMFLHFFLHDSRSGRTLHSKATGVRLPPGQWQHIGLTYDGRGDSAGITFFVAGKAVTAGEADDFTQRLRDTALARAAVRIGADGSGSLEGGALRALRWYSVELGSHEMRALAARMDVKGKERDELRFLHVASVDPGFRAVSGELDGIEKELRAIRRRGKTTLIMQERKDRQPEAHVLIRGQYDQPGDAVVPGVPSVFPTLPSDVPRNRLGLARWLVAPDNPLVARVTVNRFWQQVFGTGLVRTAEDFGATGDPPSHPELLDWLAVEFRESGWDVKRLFRTMVISATYRQAAATTPAKLKKDPENRLLSRGPRFRMDAEMLRDSALAASGLLTPVIGGPSVKPYQPDGVWEAVAVLFSDTRFYRQDDGDKLHRRSLYTLWKRSAPPASLEIFNAPSRETCTVRRERTNTPLQALVTMNDPQFVEAARRLAEEALRTARSFDERLDRITERVLSRRLRSEERAPLALAYRKFAAEYDADPKSAAHLIAVGATVPDKRLAPAELGAWTMVASAILNLDEALNK